jgi:molybdopterin-binding protein
VRLIPEGPLVRVVLDCGPQIVALVTRTAASEMELTVGSDVYAVFKTSAVHLIPAQE